MLDPREQLKGGFRAFAQRDARRREDREVALVAASHLAVATAIDPTPPTDPADMRVYGPRLVRDTPDR